MFANASKNLFMVALRSADLLRGGADHPRRPARLLDLFHGRFRKLVRLYRDAARQLTRAQHLQAVTHFVDDARCQERIYSEGVAFELLEMSQVDDGELLFEDIGEAALGKAAVQRHLATFKSALLAETGAGVLAFVAAGAGLPVSRAHT